MPTQSRPPRPTPLHPFALEPLEPRTLRDSAPIGNVDAFVRTVGRGVQVAGWSVNPDNFASPVTIEITVNNNKSTVAADFHRADLFAFFGSANHGFSVDLSSLSPGVHWIHIAARDDRTSAENELFNALLNNTPPVGNVDLIDGTRIFGWAYDADAPAAALAIFLLVDGASAGTATADLPRSDVDTFLRSPNHAFSADLPALTFGQHTIDVYAAELTRVSTSIVQKDLRTSPLDVASRRCAQMCMKVMA